MHQLRYVAAHGGDAQHALDRSGHEYLAMVEPLIGLAIAFLVGHLLWRALAGNRGRRAVRRRELIVQFAVALVTVFAAQELLEGQLAAGHASGLEGVFGSGGWLAVPLAILTACGLTMLVDVSERMPESGLLTARAVLVTGVPALRHVPIVAPRLRRLPPLASHLAGRAPPALLMH